MHNRIKDHEVKCLPAEGLMTVNGLAEFLGVRNDHLAERLNKKGIKTLDLSSHAKFRLVNLSDLKVT